MRLRKWTEIRASPQSSKQQLSSSQETVDSFVLWLDRDHASSAHTDENEGQIRVLKSNQR